jgi:hypothetical protein
MHGAECAPYQRSPAEIEQARELRTRREARAPAPKAKLQHAAGQVNVTHNHPDLPTWWNGILAAFGTTSGEFASHGLGMLLDATRVAHSKSVREEDANATLAAMTGIAPRDETEAMLAAQMIATHFAAMAAVRRLGQAESLRQQDSNGNIAVKLLRTYAVQMEALQRYRGKGQQTVVVKHVNVHQGGQAIVGAVTAGGPGGSAKMEVQPDAIADAREPALPGALEANRATVPESRS